MTKAPTRKGAKTITVGELNKYERNIVVHAIRQFGTGGHALPDEQNVVYFTPQYALRCLHQALKRAILDVHERKEIAGIILKLRN